MSVEEAMKILERLKAVHMVVKKDEGIRFSGSLAVSVMRQDNWLKSSTWSKMKIFLKWITEKFK